jgi:hypothetical protein
MRKSIVVGALLLVIAAPAGCKTTGSDPAAAGDTTNTTSAAKETKKNSAVATVGKPLQVKSESDGKAEVTVLSVTLKKAGKGEFADKPANGQFAVVDVQIKVTSGKFPINPFYLQYQTADSKTYDISAGNASGAGFDPELQSGDVPQGQSTRGVVVFDVPAGKGKQIQLTDELGSLIGVWEI